VERNTADHSLEAPAIERRARERARFWHDRIPRYSTLERVLHWLMAATGIVSLLTGLGWYTDSFEFLLTWFGGGEWARWIHGISGIVMVICAVWLIGVLWYRRVFRFIPEDWRWLKTGGGYLSRGTPAKGREGAQAPPQGFFNSGQKLWGILAVVLALLFLGSGLFIWSPELFHDRLGHQPFPVSLMRIMYVVHDAAFVVFVGMIVVHVYLSTILDRGSFEGMSKGVVSRLWAFHHHPLWYREVTGDKPEAES
jgi:formate dehydrogenase subunit gamma